MNIRIVVKADNPGNLATRNAFLKRGDEYLHGVERLAGVCRVKGSMAYKMCEPMGEFGSGTPSIAAFENEVLRERVKMDREEGRETSLALEMAFDHVRWVRRLLNGQAAKKDFRRRLTTIVMLAARISHEVDDRQLPDLSINDLSAARDHLRTLLTDGEEVLAMVEEQIQAAESGFGGVPLIGERKVRAG